MDADFLNNMTAVAKQAALAGGEKLLAMRDEFGVRKKSECDFVTDADIASQAAIQQVIEANFPEHKFVGEEGDDKSPPAEDVICWVVDPLDGTTNYLHQYPFYAVCVGVTQGAELLVGVIYDPLREELYHAAKGCGAWLNDQPIAVSKCQHIGDALISMSLPPHVGPESPDLLDFVQVVQRCQAIRRTGSAALNLANLASGKVDAYWARQINPWDVAAGALLLQEAGGVVTASDGGPFNVWEADLTAASTASLHQELLETISR